MAAALAISTAAFAQIEVENAELKRAKQELDELKYGEAAKSLEAAWAVPGNGRETSLEILELQGVVAATQGQQDRARAYFRSLLYLKPEAEPPSGDLGPKVLGLFYESKGRITADGALKFEPGAVARDEKQVYQVSVTVSDPQKLSRAVRFYRRVGNDPWQQELVVPADGQARLGIEAVSVQWWAELLGEKDRVLALVGGPDHPIATAVLVPNGSKPFSMPSLSGSPLRTASYVVAAAGVLALIGAIVFGLEAESQKNQILGATRDASGAVVGITRVKAQILNDQMKTSATLANSFFVGGGVLVGAGVVLFIVAPDGSDARVSLSGKGLTLAGSF